MLTLNFPIARKSASHHDACQIATDCPPDAASFRSIWKSSRVRRTRSALPRLCSSALVLQKSSKIRRRSFRLPIADQRASVISFGNSFSHLENGVTPCARSMHL